MTTNFRTRLLLGFTILAGLLSGCVIETTTGGPSGNCAESQYFNVRWAVESAANTLTCSATPPSHIMLSTNAGTVLEVGHDCVDGRTCADGTPCNWAGSTVGGIAAGTTAVTASLISDTDGSLLSSVPMAPPVAIRACTAVELAFVFPL